LFSFDLREITILFLLTNKLTQSKHNLGHHESLEGIKDRCCCTDGVCGLGRGRECGWNSGRSLGRRGEGVSVRLKEGVVGSLEGWVVEGESVDASEGTAVAGISLQLVKVGSKDWVSVGIQGVSQ